MSFVPTKSPFDLFKHWFDLAETNEPADHNAMSLATVDAAGHPSVRIVLLKAYSEQGFTFFTNTHSFKGQALAANSVAALNFYWKSSGQQVRVDGGVEAVTSAEADAYFASRSRGSQIGAWASQQSQTLQGGRKELMLAVQEIEQTYEGRDVPRPPHWSGYRVKPVMIEFWQAGDCRLHDRARYELTDSGEWTWRWLNP